MLNFLQLSLVDILDILLMGVLIFYVFRLLRGSQAMNIFIALMVLLVMRVICVSLNMRMLSGILGAVLDVGILAIIVIFQPEIRRVLINLGKTAKVRVSWLDTFVNKEAQDLDTESNNEICKACEAMSHDKCGALIVIQKKINLDYIVETGDLLDAKISSRLLCNLFFKNSPLHDGAVIISDDRVAAARCTLPVTENSLPPQFGMRHKAAVGISEASDAVVLVVSEETGHIMVIRGGQYKTVDNINDLKRILQNG